MVLEKENKLKQVEQLYKKEEERVEKNLQYHQQRKRSDMLTKINRLKKEKDFEKIFKKGKSFKNSFLILRIVPNNLEESRFGFIVSQKVSKKAVLRNKVKRRLRDIIQKNITEIKKGKDVALIVLPGLEKKSFLETKEILETLLKKTSLV